jgi:hypothetical protein
VAWTSSSKAISQGIRERELENFPSSGDAGWGAFCSEPFTCLPQVQERFLADGNDRLKLVVLLCGEDDDKLQSAAAGALAMLTAAHKKLCLKMTQVVSGGPGDRKGLGGL